MKTRFPFLSIKKTAAASRPKYGEVHVRFDESTGGLILIDENGNESPIGSEDITNAAVAAAIAKDPSAVWSSLLASGAAVVADASGTDTDRGTALVAAYTAAKSLTPGGSALSATNRATVIIPPGKYDVGSGLTLDTDFIDLIALTPQTPKRMPESYTWTASADNGLTQYTPQITEIYSTHAANHTITQSCADTRLTGFTIAQLNSTTASGRHALWVSLTTAASNSESIYDRLYLFSRFAKYAQNTSGCSPVSFALHADGTWKNCVATVYSWRLTANITNYFRAKMFDCQCGPYSIAGDAVNGYVTSARFERCSTAGTIGGIRGQCFAGCGTYGMPITNEAVFIECDGGDRSFAMGKDCAGSFYRCTGGSASFGSSWIGVAGTFSGYAEDCTGGEGSFGGRMSGGNASSKCTGTLVRCISNGNTQPHKLEGATIRDSRIVVTTTDRNSVELIDSNVTISNTDLIVVQGGTGVPVYAASALNAAVYGCRMNNASNDADGLHSNVTNLVSSAGNVVSNSVK